ncbi:MAG: hypothetical protein JNK45_24815, partial [Myxococcales bacterium]|nr:hypothetical protein [Myxococcales bacterium]
MASQRANRGPLAGHPWPTCGPPGHLARSTANDHASKSLGTSLATHSTSMPSLEHEMLVELLREHPELVLALLHA